MAAAFNRSRHNRPQHRTAGRNTPPRVQQLPTQSPFPSWLRSLLMLQRLSLVFTFVLAGSALAVYGWTVYAQQLWSKQYQKLDDLRRDERQLTTSKEVLKGNIAQQADRPGSTLVPQKPDSMIFLKPAPQRPDAQAPATAPSNSSVPLGY